MKCLGCNNVGHLFIIVTYSLKGVRHVTFGVHVMFRAFAGETRKHLSQ